jgi:hypothetical protein
VDARSLGFRLTIVLFCLGVAVIVRDIAASLVMAGWQLTPEGRSFDVNPFVAFCFVLTTPLVFLAASIGVLLRRPKKESKSASYIYQVDLRGHERDTARHHFSDN